MTSHYLSVKETDARERERDKERETETESKRWECTHKSKSQGECHCTCNHFLPYAVEGERRMPEKQNEADGPKKKMLNGSSQ